MPALLRVGLGRGLLLLLDLLLLLLLLDLLLLLLLKDLALLHLLHYLLRRTDGAVGAEAGPHGVLRLGSLNGGLRLFFRLLRNIFVRILLRAIHASGRAGGAILAWAEHDFAWGSLPQVSGEQDVVSGALEQLREHVTRLAGTVDPVNALVGAHTFYLRSRLSRDFPEDLLEAGVGSIDAKSIGIPDDGRRAGLVVRWPIGHWRRRRSLGERRRLLLFRSRVGAGFAHLRLL
jgi:hypothetical protein